MKSGFSLRNWTEKVEALPSWVLLVVASVLYIPLVFFGYGSDSDSLGVVCTGQYFIATFDYLPSRLPGFFVHEFFVFFLNQLGGSVLTNLGSVCISLVMLHSFRQVCRHYAVPHPTLLSSVLMVQPFFWVSAASTIDYLWALGFCFLGFNLLLHQRNLPAAISLALSVGCRLSTVLPVGLFLCFLFLTSVPQRRWILLTSFCAALMSIVFFLPPLDFLEWDFRRWLVLSTGDPALWTPVLRVGRFLYKNLMFFSLPVVLWACFLCLSALFHKQKPTLPRPDSLSWLSLAVILSVEIMFLRIPIEMEYLLPLLPFALILIGKLLPNHPGQLWLLLALTLLANFLWINPARSLTPNQTSEVIYGLWLEPGYLLQDIATRLSLLKP